MTKKASYTAVHKRKNEKGNLDQIRSYLGFLHVEQGYTLRQIASLFDHLTYGDISRILRGIEPKAPLKRLEMGLPSVMPAPVCPIHNVVHLGRCPGERQYRDLYAIPLKTLAKMINERR
jgi:hypothetical protein